MGLVPKSQIWSTSFWRGLHFSRSQGPNPHFGWSCWSSWRAQRAIFGRISTFWHLETQIFARPQGRPAKTWPVLALSSLSLGRILGSGPPLQVLDQVLEEFCHSLPSTLDSESGHTITNRDAMRYSNSCSPPSLWSSTCFFCGPVFTGNDLFSAFSPVPPYTTSPDTVGDTAAGHATPRGRRPARRGAGPPRGGQQVPGEGPLLGPNHNHPAAARAALFAS